MQERRPARRFGICAASRGVVEQQNTSGKYRGKTACFLLHKRRQFVGNTDHTRLSTLDVVLFQTILENRRARRIGNFKVIRYVTSPVSESVEWQDVQTSMGNDGEMGSAYARSNRLEQIPVQFLQKSDRNGRAGIAHPRRIVRTGMPGAPGWP